MELLSALSCVAGFAALAAAAGRQQHAILGQDLPIVVTRGLRVTGAILLLGTLVLLVSGQGWGLGLVDYSGYTSLAAGCVYCALIVSSRRERPGRR